MSHGESGMLFEGSIYEVTIRDVYVIIIRCEYRGYVIEEMMIYMIIIL